jgi:predicted nucleic acid-binding protein
MPVRVVDASALAAVLFNEPKGEAVARHLVHADLLAPALLPFELMSICRKKLRLYPAEREHIFSQWALSDQMGIRYEPLRLGEVLSLAESAGLTTYDASYLWLAKARDADLVTVDQDLHRAATKLLTPPRSLPESH